MGVSYQVFARKYRPQTFDDVLGQDHVVQTLKNAIEQKRLAHAYLFVGPRGTGKTSTARIFAKALNCPNGPSVTFDPNDPICQEIAEGRSLDVLEIDGASNNGVEQVRDLRDNVQFAPACGQFRIYYIDEVHMLSKAAFNALLKTLEEPPPHVKFIFATTEAHKILPTILSRCQRFDLRPISTDIIAGHLLHIATQEGVQLSQGAAYAIAKAADGGMRDAQSMLDQLVSFCGNTIEEPHVLDIFGITSRETVCQAIGHMLGRRISSVLQIIHDQSEAGRDLSQFLGEMIFGIREVLISKVDGTATIDGISQSLRDYLQTCVATLDTSKLLRLIEILAETQERMKWATNKRLHLEIGLIKAVHSLSEANISDIIRALDGAPLTEYAAPAALPVIPDMPEAEVPSPAVPVPAKTSAPLPPHQEPLEPAKTEEPAESKQTPEPVMEAQPEVPDAPEEQPLLEETTADHSEKNTNSPTASIQSEETALPGTEQAEISAPIDDAPETAITKMAEKTAEDAAAITEPVEPDPLFISEEQKTAPTQEPVSAPVTSVQETASTYTPQWQGDDDLSLFSNFDEQPDIQSVPLLVVPAAKKEPLPLLVEEPIHESESYPEDEPREDEMPRGFIDENTAPLFGEFGEEADPLPVRQEGAFNGAQLWEETLQFLNVATPLKFISIEHVPFRKLENNVLSVGVNPNDLMARDVLIAQDMKGKIEQFLAEKSGAPLKFSMETTDAAPMPEEVDLEPIDFSTPAAPAPQPKEPAPAPKQELPKEPEPTKEETIFYNDPLIEEALQIFQAKIVS